MNEVCVFGVKKEERKKEDKKGIGAGAIFGIVLLLLFVIGIAAWCVYAYRHPTSKSGLFFIEVKLFSVTLMKKITEQHWSTNPSVLPNYQSCIYLSTYSILGVPLNNYNSRLVKNYPKLLPEKGTPPQVLNIF